MAEKNIKTTQGLPEPPKEIVVAAPRIPFDWKRVLFILLGLGLFLFIYFMPAWSDAVDPTGKAFPLSQAGKGAIALFLLAGIWWVFEVIPIGATALAIGMFQALFDIRSAKDAFKDFMDPSVMFIFGSVVVGLAFTKAGLTKRIAYKMLELVGENTGKILLGALLVTASGKFHMTLGRVQLGEVIESAADTVRPTARARDIQLELAIDSAAGPVWGDAGRLQQGCSRNSREETSASSNSQNICSLSDG